jgi:hypothetical protein
VSSDRFHIITPFYEQESYKQSSVNNADHGSDIPEAIAVRLSDADPERIASDDTVTIVLRQAQL